MSKRVHRSGGKFGKNHSTFTPLSAEVADSVVQLDVVKRVVSSIITCPGRRSSSCKRVKVVTMDTAILLRISDGAMCHEVWVHAVNKGHLGTIGQHIGKWCSDEKINVVFMDGPSPP